MPLLSLCFIQLCLLMCSNLKQTGRWWYLNQNILCLSQCILIFPFSKNKYNLHCVELTFDLPNTLLANQQQEAYTLIMAEDGGQAFLILREEQWRQECVFIVLGYVCLGVIFIYHLLNLLTENKLEPLKKNLRYCLSKELTSKIIFVCFESTDS